MIVVLLSTRNVRIRTANMMNLDGARSVNIMIGVAMRIVATEAEMSRNVHDAVILRVMRMRRRMMKTMMETCPNMICGATMR